jgi:hypothetical protein
MFARNVSIRLKPNTFTDFNKTFESDIVPMLRKQTGFRDEIALSGDNDLHVTAISLWDSKEQAEAYDKAVYPQVLQMMDKYLDGAPKVRNSSVINSTTHKITPVVAA